MRFSVIVPTYNAQKRLPLLLDSLDRQSEADFETIVVDDVSRDRTVEIAAARHCRIVRSTVNKGPATCRNRGARHARGDILVFIDDDCRADRLWLENLRRQFEHGHDDAVMGRLLIDPANPLGNAISALGFPGGGSTGFDKIWKVNANGFTDSLSSCNCAVKKRVFDHVGGFDQSFPYPGGEDSVLAHRLRTAGYRIRYCPAAMVHHGARATWADFLGWQFKRGISSYIFATKVTRHGKFISLRLWSTRNILRHFRHDTLLPLIVCLLGLSFGVQLLGFLWAKHKKEFHARSHN